MTLAFLLTICLIMLAIGVLALRDNTKSATNRFFFLFVLFFDFWILSNYASNFFTDYTLAYISNQLVFFSTSFLILFLAYFITVYPNAKLKINKYALILSGLAGVFVSVVSLTDLIVQGITIKNGYSDITFGDGIYIYAIFFVVLLIYSIVMLVIKFRKAVGIEKLKIQYLALGIIVTAIGALITNLILPLAFDSFSLSNLGTGFSLILVTMAGYSIIRHRLLGIRMLLGNLLSILTISIYTFVIFYIVLLFENKFLKTPFSPDSFSINIVIAIFFSILFIVLYNKIHDDIRKSYIHTSYEPNEELDKFNESVSKKLEVEEISRVISESLKDVLKVSKVSIILFDENNKQIYGDQISIDNIESEQFSEFFRFLQFKPSIQEELESIVLSGKANTIQSKLYDWNLQNKFSSLIPLNDTEGFRGFIALGERGILYDEIDIGYLESISRSSSIAFGRAKYFNKYKDLINELENKVKERTKQLQDKDEEQKNIIDVMGHEIRTPLSIINNEIALQQEITLSKKDKWLKKEMSDKEIDAVFEGLQVIGRATAQSIALVNDMLETARLDKGRFELNYKKFDIVQIVKSSVNLMSKSVNAETHNISFKTDLDTLEVDADETRVTEAIQALISNAIKYGINPDTEKADITVTLEKKEDCVQITISDQGMGIAKEDIEKLGQKFMRLNPQTKNLQRPNGTGLGLFVVKNIMEAHKGQMIIKSEGIGKGSSFILLLPIEKSE